MQTASSRVWTRVDVFISYDDTHYIIKFNYFIFSSGAEVTDTLLKSISAKWNAKSLVQDLKSARRTHFIRQ